MVGTGTREGTFRSALSHRSFRYLLASLTVSETGNWLYAAASIVYILQATGSLALVGIAGVIRLLPYILFSPIGGAIADRYDRRAVLIVTDLARALVMAILAVVARSTSHAAVFAVIGLAFVNNTFSAPYYPAVTALTPSLVPERDLAAANALSGTIDNFALAFGPALSALLLLLGPPPVAFAANGLTFLFSALMVARIRVHGRVGEVDAASSFLTRISAGAKAIRGSREAVLLIGMAMAFGFVFGQEVVLFGPIAERLGLGADATGLFFAAPGVGGILVTGMAARLAARSRTAVILTTATFIGGIPLTVLSVVDSPSIALLLLTLEGAAIIVADIVTTTTLQRVVPNERVGSAFGILGAMTVLATAAGSLIAPISIDVFGLAAATALAGGVLLVVTAIVLPKAHGIDRAGGARADLLAPRVALLDRLGIFEAASPQQLEGLAAAADEEHVPAGQVIIREGDEPDDLFGIVTGTLDVRTGEGVESRVVATLGEGDYFGEIGLLEQRPRTATVIATSDVTLYRIPGEDFLRILNEGPRLSSTLTSAVANRLSVTHPYEEMGHS